MGILEKFFERAPDVVAKELLGKTIIRKIGNTVFVAKIVETEAYFDEKDPASRACKKGDLRETMKMKGGTILVYGVHNNWLMNFVTGKEGEASAVLLRALEPINFSYNCSGPGLLTRAFKIDKSFHKKSIINNEDLWIDLSSYEKIKIAEAKRIGVREDLESPFRFYIEGNVYVSKK